MSWVDWMALTIVSTIDRVVVLLVKHAVVKCLEWVKSVMGLSISVGRYAEW